MIVKGLSMITSLCVLLFLGAVAMQKLVTISDSEKQEEKIASYEQMDSLDENRKDVESHEVLNEIKEKTKNMVLGAKKIATKGLKKTCISLIKAIVSYEKERFIVLLGYGLFLGGHLTVLLRKTQL